MARQHKLARARSRLQRYLSEGWQRAVFTSPQTGPAASGTDPGERVIEGPGPGPVTDEVFAELMQSAREAAREGLVKQVYVVDDTRRIEIDARHGIPRERVRDAATIDKIMGGKRRALRPDRSEALLRSIGIMNADGTISARRARKYKQVNHLIELCRPVWTKLRESRPESGPSLDAGPQAKRADASSEAPSSPPPLHILDLACGNSYLCFVLAETFRIEEIPAKILGIDVREDVVERSRSRARELGFTNLEFSRSTIDGAREDAAREFAGRIDMMISLHACDRATDQALALAILQGVSTVFCVPCCQAELARELGEQEHAPPSPSRAPASGQHVFPVAALWRHGLLRRAYAETLTDALRVEILGACGYSVTVLEFVESEHTAKNLLIRAHRRSAADPIDPASWRLGELRTRCQSLGLHASLLDLLIEAHPV